MQTIDVRPLPPPVRHQTIFETLDALGTGDQRRIVGDRRAVRRHGGIEFRGGRHDGHVVDADLPERLRGTVEGPVGDDADLHPGGVSRDLIDEPLTGEPRSDESDAHRVTCGLTILQCLVDDDHDAVPFVPDSSVKSGQLLSLSETITPSVIGHSMPNAGSSQRTPRSSSGAYSALTL